MGTHPIFESDFDCLTDCQALRLAFEMAKKDTGTVGLEEIPVSPPISRRTRNKKIQECFVEVERVKLDMEEKELESGDAPVTTNVETDQGQTKEIDSTETPDEENAPDESGDKEISENEQEKSDHGSEPDAEETEDVTKLSNKELKEKLTSLGITTGPIVDSTRKIYERKLEKLLAKGKDLAYSTDEDAVPEQEIETEEAEPVKEKKVTRTKKAPKSDPVVEEKFSDEEDEEPVVKNSSSRRRSARILKSKSKKDTDVEQIEEQGEEAEEEAEVEQEEESVEANKDEEVEVAKDESKSTESVQVLSTKTAITSHIHTILFLALVAIAGYLLYSEADAIQSALEDMWDYAVASYSKLYYSMMPEIETIQPETPSPPPAAEPQVGDPVPTDEL